MITAKIPDRASDRMLSRDELCSGAELTHQVAQQLSSLAEKHAEDIADGPQLEELVERVKGLDSSESSTTGKAGQMAPIVAVSGPAGILVNSQDALALSGISAVDVISAADARIGAGANLMLRATRGLSMFAFKLGIKLVAASGNIRMQAQNGDIEITSLKRIKLIANEGIELQSPAVKIVAQGCQANYEGGEITQQSKGVHTIKSSKFSHKTGGEGSPENLDLPSTVVKHDQHVLITDLMTDEPLANRKYRITVEDGNVFEGTTNQAGLTEIFCTDVAFATYEIELLE